MQILKIVSAILSVITELAAFYFYIKDILFFKNAKPHAYTWFIWSVTQSTAVVALWYGGGGLGAIGLSISSILVFCVFIFSLKRGTKNITLGDTLVLTVALMAIFVWWQLDNPVLAVFMISAIDAIGYIPSYRKSWSEPWSETLLPWILFSMCDIFAIIALREYNFLTLTYLITIAICNFIIVFLCLLRRRKIKGT